MILQSLFSIKYVILHLSPKTSVKNMLCTELTPDKIIVVRYRKIKSLFCKSCCELHNAASILILLDTLANYGSLCLLLSLLILLIRAFLAGWRGYCSHHARCCLHARIVVLVPEVLSRQNGRREVTSKMLMFWWQLYLCLQLRSLSLSWIPHASNYTVGLCDSFSLIGVLIAFCPETMRFSTEKKKSVNQHNSMAGILNNLVLHFHWKKKKKRETN